MNRIAAIALFVGTTLIMGGSAAAQSKVVEINVPFNFSVNNTLLPAGSYTFGFDSLDPDMLIIQDPAKNIQAKGLGQRGSIDQGRPRTVIFHRYGGQYFLTAVRIGSDSSGMFLPATKSEQQAKRVSRKQNRKVSGNEELASIAVD
jgi:hypothetical protein